MISYRIDTYPFQRRIVAVFETYERKAYDIFAHYATEAMKYMQMVQGNAGKGERGAFWTNHTFRAVEAFFAKAWQVPTKRIGVNFKYKPDPFYTDILETGHGGRFAALPTILKVFEPLIIKDLQRLYGRD